MQLFVLVQMQDGGPVADDILTDEFDLGLFPEILYLC